MHTDVGMGYTRRSVLKGLLGGIGAGFVAHLAPPFVRRAEAANLGVYPTIFIDLPSGLDSFMHFDARTGLVNRNVQAADIMQTAGGVRWYQPTLAGIATHMADCTLIRNLRSSTSHTSGEALLWFGEGNDALAAAATPWPNFLASSLLSQLKVAAPNVTTYADDPDDAIVNYINFNNRSPAPLGAAQRVQGVATFTRSLDVLGGQPSPAFQGRVFQAAANFDKRLYSPTVQARTTGSFAAANALATDLLTQPIPPVWPPDTATMTAFNMTAADLTTTVGSGNQRMVTHLALAYQLAKNRLSHVMFIRGTQGGYDTHSNHDAGQRARSAIYFPAIGRLLTALKNTPSPVSAGVSMFDTTNIVITTELTRANQADTGEGTDGLGTPHWGWTQAALFGGAFKRGYSFGGLNDRLEGIATDPTTGALNTGIVPTIKNLLATVIQAGGVAPAGWTTAAPLTAVLK